MRINLLIVSYSILIAFFFIGCEQSNENDISEDQIIPLRVGNYWEYEIISYDSSGAITSIDTTLYTVTNDTLIGGISYYYYNYDNTALYTNKDDGFWKMYRNNTGIIYNNLIRKYPVAENDIYVTNLGEYVEVKSTTLTMIDNIVVGRPCIHYRIYENEEKVNYTDVYTEIGCGDIKRVNYKQSEANIIYKVRESLMLRFVLFQ